MRVSFLSLVFSSEFISFRPYTSEESLFRKCVLNVSVGAIMTELEERQAIDLVEQMIEGDVLHHIRRAGDTMVTDNFA